MDRLRFPIAALLAGLIVSGLFGLLYAASTVRSKVTEALELSKIEFVRLRTSMEIEEKKREKAQIEKPEQAPVTPTMQIAKESGVNLELDVEAIAAGLGAEFGSAGGGGGDGTRRGALAFSAGLSDRDPLPLVRVEPQYPPQAARRGLEGWVHVRFTITTAGSIKDAVVVKSSHGVFERPALQAVAKWKYQPQTKDGKPVEAQSETVLRFEMPKG
ncbi:MAG TPA: TonB family protein [Myxococcota bacterium]|nr:TonB family protein [Myxococcota bacterium]